MPLFLCDGKPVLGSILPNCLIICCDCSNCFKRRLTSATVRPHPFAILSFRFALRIEGFLLSYAHAVWIYTYGWSGVWIGFGMRWVQNLLIVFTLCVMTCLSAWLKGIDKKTAWVIRISIAVLAAFSVAAVETFGIPIFFEWVNRQ